MRQQEKNNFVLKRVSEARQATITKTRQPSRREIGVELWPIVLLVLAFGLMILGAIYPQTISAIRVSVMEVTAPIYRTLSTPIASVNRMIDEVQHWQNIHEENAQLRQRVTELERAAHQLHIANQENARLTELLAFDKQRAKRYLSVPVIGSGTNWLRSLMIDGGNNRGITPNMIATDGTAMLGRVVEVGTTTSRILMINDLNSRIPASTAYGDAAHGNSTQGGTSDSVRFILAGQNDGLGQLLHLPQKAKLQHGTPVITSGDGGKLPKGLLLGHITAIQTGTTTEWRVKFAANLTNTHILQLIEY